MNNIDQLRAMLAQDTYPQVRQMLEGLMASYIERNEWDLPIEFFFVVGSPAQPRVHPTPLLAHSPHEVEEITKNLPPLPPQVIGLVAQLETWRGLTWDETVEAETGLFKHAIEAITTARDKAKADGDYSPEWEEKTDDAIELAKRTHETILRSVPPSMLPEQYRVEERILLGYLRETGPVALIHSRGKQETIYNEADKIPSENSPVLDALRKILERNDG